MKIEITLNATISTKFLLFVVSLFFFACRNSNYVNYRFEIKLEPCAKKK